MREQLDLSFSRMGEQVNQFFSAVEARAYALEQDIQLRLMHYHFAGFEYYDLLSFDDDRPCFPLGLGARVHEAIETSELVEAARGSREAFRDRETF